MCIQRTVGSVAESVEHQTLDVGSCGDIWVVRSSPGSSLQRAPHTAESARDSLSLSSHVLSLSQNK